MMNPGLNYGYQNPFQLQIPTLPQPTSRKVASRVATARRGPTSHGPLPPSGPLEAPRPPFGSPPPIGAPDTSFVQGAPPQGPTGPFADVPGGAFNTGAGMNIQHPSQYQPMPPSVAGRQDPVLADLAEKVVLGHMTVEQAAHIYRQHKFTQPMQMGQQSAGMLAAPLR